MLLAISKIRITTHRLNQDNKNKSNKIFLYKNLKKMIQYWNSIFDIIKYAYKFILLFILFFNSVSMLVYVWQVYIQNKFKLR